MREDYDYIIVGGGLCGLVLAKELAKTHKNLLILEKGTFINKLGTIRRVFNFYDKHALLKSNQGVLIYRALGVGGTSIVSCGNAVEFTDEAYKKIGIDFQKELAEAKRESFVRDEGLTIGKASTRIMEVANKLGYFMRPMPKFNITGKCLSCGDCYVGCRYGTKWTAQEALKEIDSKNVHLITNFSVNKVISGNRGAVGVEGSDKKFKKQKFFAHKIILSAGGIGTPIILQHSGIEAGDNLFVDLFNITYGPSREFNQKRELTMSVVCDKFHRDEGFVLSPFVDNFYGFASHAQLRHFMHTFRLNRIMGIMNKIADDSIGKVHKNGRIDKAPTEADWKKLKRGSDIAREILIACGINPKNIFVTKPRGAHPGGTAGIGRIVNHNLETSIKNLYICDASVLPFAPGLPPMLTLIALAKWFGKQISGAVGTKNTLLKETVEI